MDRRFAILIGINDYSTNPLDYCVKDVNDVKSMLLESCKFDSNDIRVIQSSESNPQMKISLLLENAIRSIEPDFEKNKDSVFFFFSGHGERNKEGAVLKLHEDEQILQSIIDKIEDRLSPRHEFYVIDACYSGDKIKSGKEDIEIENTFTVNRFSLKSESFNILTASRYDQKASEKRKFQNGTLTHFFLEAIKTVSNYNKFGFISPDTISNYVQINVSLDKHFEQIPYSLNKNSGTFPFGFMEPINPKKDKSNPFLAEINSIHEAPTVHFNYRLLDAFPGVRGVQWFDDKIAIEGLIRFFEKPLIYEKAIGYGVVCDPIWWFRGNSALTINRFEVMEDDKILLNSWELRIDKIAIFNGSSYWNNIIYVNTKPDSPTELYSRTKEQTLEIANEYGYASDYFGYCDGRIIKPEQAEDKGGIIDGKFVKLENAEIRERFITPYNFILVAKFSPANTTEGNKLGEEYMNDILKGIKSLEDFVEKYNMFPRHIYD
ncbi:MAG: caspase family protein [Saprospiraceae bacterium]|nr:caspase family protein [Saprospiraceae bacterium]